MIFTDFKVGSTYMIDALMFVYVIAKTDEGFVLNVKNTEKIVHVEGIKYKSEVKEVEPYIIT